MSNIDNIKGSIIPKWHLNHTSTEFLCQENLLNKYMKEYRKQHAKTPRLDIKLNDEHPKKYYCKIKRYKTRQRKNDDVTKKYYEKIKRAGALESLVVDNYL